MWKLNSKNLPVTYVRAAKRKIETRTALGKRSRIMFRGSDVALEEVERSDKRHKRQATKREVQSLARLPTPSDFDLFIPPANPSLAISVDIYEKHEQIIWNIRNWFSDYYSIGRLYTLSEQAMAEFKSTKSTMNYNITRTSPLESSRLILTRLLEGFMLQIT